MIQYRPDSDLSAYIKAWLAYRNHKALRRAVWAARSAV